ncbi:1437_t:CDS:1, partial [Racocetra fulgida]
YEALILERLKLMIPTNKKDERKDELLQKDNLTAQEDKELLTLVKEIEKNRNILREQAKKSIYSSPFSLFDYDYNENEYDSDDNESDIFDYCLDTDDEEDEEEQAENSQKTLTKLKNQTESD